MNRSNKKDTKKSTKMGRPATGQGQQIGTRWSDDVLRRVDDWRRVQPDIPTRPEALRRLVLRGLEVDKK
ncbi:conserved hypothetical protein [Hyphomicrobium sp. GJ21]|nr:conserved hypothetical protein [Hyphomicrobium sp. GJ21]